MYLMLMPVGGLQQVGTAGQDLKILILHHTDESYNNECFFIPSA